MDGAASADAGIIAVAVESIVTGIGVIAVGTTGYRVAAIISTHIAICAQGIIRCSVTCTCRAGIVFSTGHSIITGRGIIRIAAAYTRCTDIIGADIAIST